MKPDEIQRLYDAIGRRVAAERAAKVPPMTQQDLADATDSLSRSAVANIESFRQRVSLHQLLELAEALSVHPSSLLPDLQAERGPTVEELRETADDRIFLESFPRRSTSYLNERREG